MTPALAERLQASLGTAYTLERELAGGGMSHVFVAVDARLGRRVAIKVLHPDLAAGLSARRFEREVRLAARLQHPHVLPLLSAGAVDGLPYYTAPFVEGESLRARLPRDGALPFADAARLARELADALAYAHAQGVVHRDLKPENVLLSGGHAVVADFGVAKALSAATQGGDVEGGATGGRTTDTALGVVVGTPAYMAPERAAGDPAVDHRADLYALGVVAYELLAGEPPFTGRAPRALVAAHLSEAPAPLAARRPDTPAAFAALVMRLLAKAPEDRPQTAADVVRVLDALGAVAATPVRADDGRATGARSPWARVPRRPWPRAAALALAGAAALGGLWWVRRERAPTPGAAASTASAGTVAPAARERPRVLVDLFENRTGDPALDPVGQMAADWVVRALASADLVEVVDASTATALARGGSAPGTPAADSAAGRGRLLRVAEAVRAGTLVVGRYYRRGDSLEFQAQVVDARSGRVLRTVQPAAGLVASPGPVVGVLRGRVAAAALAPNTHAHVQSGRQAMWANRIGDAVRIFRSIDPEAPALRGWWLYYARRADAHHLAGQHAEELAVARRGRARQPAQRRLVRSEAAALAALGRADQLEALLDAESAWAADDPAEYGWTLLHAARELRAHGHAAAARAASDRAVTWLRAQEAPAGDRTARPVPVRGAPPTRGPLIAALYDAGRWQEARALVEPVPPGDTAVSRLADAALTAARLGDTLAARRYDARLAALRTPYLHGAHTYHRARLAAALGEPARAVALLREAFAQGTPYFRSHAERDFKPLRGHAPFDALVRPKE